MQIAQKMAKLDLIEHSNVTCNQNPSECICVHIVPQIDIFLALYYISCLINI